MKAIVIYYSHKGRTANYAREIAMYLMVERNKRKSVLRFRLRP